MTRTTWQVPPKGAGFLVLLVALLLAATWLFFKAFIVASALAGALAAVLLRRWHTKHPSLLPYSPRTRVPEINLSRIPVAGDEAGLMFAVGGVAVVIIGVPDLAWYYAGSLACAGLLAWGLFACRSARGALDGHPLGLSSRA